MKKSLFFNHFHIIILLLWNLSVENTLAQPLPSFRGLAVINDSIAVVSGSQGKVYICKNGSEVMTDISPKGYTKKDFRDIHVHKKTITVMSSGDSAVILQSQDFGKNWTPVFTENQVGIFLDAIEIHPLSGAGICMGDPMANSVFYPKMAYANSDSFFVALLTPDFGKHWYPIPRGSWNKSSPKLKSLFAASGSSVKCTQLNVFPSLNNPFKIPKNKEKSYGLETSHLLKELIVTLEFYFAGGGNQGTEIRKCKMRVSLVLDTQDSTQFHTELVSVDVKSVPLELPIGYGWGIYALDTYIEGSETYLVATGGHWKYADSNSINTYNIPVSMFQSNNNSTIIKPITYTKFKSQYHSGICVIPASKTLVAVGSNGLHFSQIYDKTGKVLNPLRLKKWQSENTTLNLNHINAVYPSMNYLWIIGSKNLVQRIPLNLIN